jgi:hypothetical protein
MSKAISAHLVITDELNRGTAKYLRDVWGVWVREPEEAEGSSKMTITTLHVEIRDYPAIMEAVEKSGYFKEQPHVWDIMKISEAGIAFYLASFTGYSETERRPLYEENYIFVPIGNIIALHNISEQLFINEATSTLLNS